MPDIVLAGVAVLDFIFEVEEMPRRPEKYRAKNASVSGGGNAANAAVAISRLGGNARLVARLGDDPVADLIETGLQDEGVQTDLIRRFAGKRSSFSSIYIDANGERQIMNFRDNGISINADWMPAILPPRFDAILADTRWPDGAVAAMKIAAERGKPGVLDVEAPAHEAIEAIKLASHPAFSAQGVIDFAGIENVPEATLHASKILQQRIYVTDGANGTYTAENGVLTNHPAFDIHAVDTLGAGDIWHGAFTIGLAENMHDNEAIRFANAAAALKCTRRGGREGAPSRQEVESFIKANS